MKKRNESTSQECPRCSSDRTSVVSQVESVRRSDGMSVEYEDSFTRCGACENDFYTKEQSLAHSRSMADAIRQSEGLYGPSQIKTIRERLGLSQALFEKALGVGPKTVVRWERGTIAPSRAANGLVWLADHHPVVFSKLAKANGVELTPVRAAKASRHTSVVILSTAQHLTVRETTPAHSHSQASTLVGGGVWRALQSPDEVVT